MRPSHLAAVLAALGTLFSVFIAVFKADHPGGAIWFLVLFVSGPWLVVDALLLWRTRARGIAIASGLMLALEVLIYLGVFVFPQSSTDALVYAVKPFIQLLVLLPFGLLVGWLRDKRVAELAGPLR